MTLVLRGDPGRRERLREIGEVLIRNHSELRSSDAALLAQRWAAELDVTRFVAEPHDEGVAVRVDYPADVVDALQNADGGRLARSMRLTELMWSAIQIRDGKEPPGGAPNLWRGVTAAVEDAAQDDDSGVYAPQDILAASATALIIAAAAGEDVPDDELATAAQFLLAGAEHFGALAPPDEGTAVEDEEVARGRDVPDMAWDMGADRSIAMGLPTMLKAPVLCERAGVAADVVADGVRAVAATPFDGARARLSDGLSVLWDEPCSTHESAHAAALAAARRMIATEGRGPRKPYGYLTVTLAEPLEDRVASSDDVLFDVGSSAFAVLVLAGAKNADCVHAQAAAALLDVLLEYDRRVWPTTYARHHYHRTGMWRRAVDTVVCDRVLAGDDALLQSYLEAFASVGEELRGLLVLLVERGSSDATAIRRLHTIWPRVLDRLLPDVRDLSPRDGDRDKEPYHRDVDELDEALLLTPSDNAEDWPLEETFKLGVRWLAAFQSAPHVADRAIVFVGRILGLLTDLGIDLVLRVLGDDIRSIRRESTYVTTWLEVVLTRAEPGNAVRKARALLDRLAGMGDDSAISVQQRLEA